MIVAAHVILFTKAAEETRAFLRDALGFSSVDAGGGWLIFALPPAEVAVQHAGARFDPVQAERWGRISVMTMPGGARLPIYQPQHASPILSTLEGA
jgi:catechol 2,3-dioxygenase-like lactoylglutathione lyase family enzyme